MLVGYPDPLADSTVVALPFSRSHIERLGARLIAEAEPPEADIAELHQLLEAYDEVLTGTLTRVRAAMDVAPTSRVKNTGTILEKLHRHGGSWLKSMHDLAGMRIVNGANRNEQDTLVRQLIELFADEPREPRVIDRRENPSHGYRAVHVIAFPEDMAVEIQVRSRWQHEWADMFEKVADLIGRDIRYGAPPEHWQAESKRAAFSAPEAALYDAEYRMRQGVVTVAVLVADLIGLAEEMEKILPTAPELAGYRRETAENLVDLRRRIEQVRALAARH